MTITLPDALYRLGRVRSLSERLVKQHPEIGFENEGVQDGFARSLVFDSAYVHFFTNYRICTTPEDIDDIAQKAGAIDVDAGRHFMTALDYLVQMLEMRLANLLDPPFYRVISVGRDCLPRSVPTKWGLKPPRVLGEKSMPFDLAVHSIGTVAEILENGFANYPVTNNIWFDPNLNHCVDTKRGILWNHEIGREWAENHFEKLEARYFDRIRNFRHALSESRPSVVVFYENQPFNEITRDNFRRIATATKAIAVCPIALLCIASSTANSIFNEAQEQIVETIDGVPIVYVRNPLPHVWYMWFDHRHYTLDAGPAFERKIIEGVQLASKLLL